MSEKIITVARFDTEQEAEHVRGSLEASGIASVIAKEYKEGKDLMNCIQVSAVKVQVFESDVDRATRKVEKYQQTGRFEELDLVMVEENSYGRRRRFWSMLAGSLGVFWLA